MLRMCSIPNSSRFQKTLKIGRFTLSICRGRQRNLPRIIRHVQLLFGDVLVAVAVVFCARSLTRGNLRLNFCRLLESGLRSSACSFLEQRLVLEPRSIIWSTTWSGSEPASSKLSVSWGAVRKMPERKHTGEAQQKKAPRFSPIFSLAVLRAAPQLTECLEEACRPRTCGPRIRNSKHKTRAIK